MPIDRRVCLWLLDGKRENHNRYFTSPLYIAEFQIYSENQLNL